MAVSSTTMSDLLDQVKTTMLSYSNTTLSKIKTWQKGVLPPTPITPALAILPRNERFIYNLPNNKYMVDRAFSIEVYDYKGSSEAAKDNTVDLIKAVKNILQDEFTFSGEAHSSKWGDETYGYEFSSGAGAMQMSSIEVISRSRETMPTRVIPTTISNDVNIKTLQNTILSTIKSNKDTYYPTVQTMVDSPEGVVLKLPLIYVAAESSDREQTKPGADFGLVKFIITVQTSLLPKAQSLNWNLSIVEGLKDVLQANYTFGGLCENSWIDSIEYSAIKDNTPIYATMFYLTCKLREIL